MVDGSLWALVYALEDRRGEILDVDNICRRVLVLGRARLLLLVQFVVEEYVLVVIGHPALVSVGGALIDSPGQDTGLELAREVVNGEGVLVVSEADLTTFSHHQVSFLDAYPHGEKLR